MRCLQMGINLLDVLGLDFAKIKGEIRSVERISRTSGERDRRCQTSDLPMDTWRASINSENEQENNLSHSFLRTFQEKNNLNG